MRPVTNNNALIRVYYKTLRANLESAKRLILDLRGLTFFGTQGFSILRICDPACGLPVARSLQGAIHTAVRPPRTHLRVVGPEGVLR